MLCACGRLACLCCLARLLDCICSQHEQLPSTWLTSRGVHAVLCVQALADVHRRGFIHRDVKTENFCLDAAGSNKSIKIIDFGFSRMAFGVCCVSDGCKQTQPAALLQHPGALPAFPASVETGVAHQPAKTVPAPPCQHSLPNRG